MINKCSLLAGIPEFDQHVPTSVLSRIARAPKHLQNYYFSASVSEYTSSMLGRFSAHFTHVRRFIPGPCFSVTIYTDLCHFPAQPSTGKIPP